MPKAKEINSHGHEKHHHKKSNANKRTKKYSSSSDSGGESEHELFYYENDRVRLMKEVLKILKLKKIKALAPDFIKKMNIEEINTMLLEELLGISKKRLKKILDGLIVNDDEESSSSDEDKAIDVISLDSISDGEDLCFIETTENDKSAAAAKGFNKHKRRRKIKKEKKDLEVDKTKKPEVQSDKLLSVLELLELQARARAIRSQLAIEAENKAKSAKQQENVQHNDDDDDIVVEIAVPEVKEIVISSGESDNEGKSEKVTIEINGANNENDADQNGNGADKNEKSSPEEKGSTTSQNEPPSGSKQKVTIIEDHNVGDLIKEVTNNVSSDQIVTVVDNIIGVNTTNDKKVDEEGTLVDKKVVNLSKNPIIENDDDIIDLDVVEIDGIDD